MAIYQEDTRVRCACGCDTFSDVKLFVIDKKQNSSQLTRGIIFEKTFVKAGLMCTKCSTVMDDPMV